MTASDIELRLVKVGIHFSIAFTLIVLAACTTPQHRETVAVSEPRVPPNFAAQFEAVENSDVRWITDGDHVEPSLNSYAEQLLISMESETHAGVRDDVMTACLWYLNDSRRYVVAHVILTYLKGEPFTASYDHWNSLAIDRSGANGLSVYGDQQASTRDFWLHHR